MMVQLEKKEANEQTRPLGLQRNGDPQSARRISKHTSSSRQPGSGEKPHHLYILRGEPSCQLSVRFVGGMSQDDLKRYYNLIDHSEIFPSIQNEDKIEKTMKNKQNQTRHVLRQISTRLFLRKDKKTLDSSKASSRSESSARFSVNFSPNVNFCFIPHAADYPEHVWSSCWFPRTDTKNILVNRKKAAMVTQLTPLSEHLSYPQNIHKNWVAQVISNGWEFCQFIDGVLL